MLVVILHFCVMLTLISSPCVREWRTTVWGSLCCIVHSKQKSKLKSSISQAVVGYTKQTLSQTFLVYRSKTRTIGDIVNT